MNERIVNGVDSDGGDRLSLSHVEKLFVRVGHLAKVCKRKSSWRLEVAAETATTHGETLAVHTRNG